MSVRRALVVDDEEPLARLVSEYLRRDGFVVSVAADGETAVELARSERPDVIVLDLMLPGIDGVEACRRIRTFSDAYIVMLTARVEELDVLVGLSVGADDYVTKPFSPRELVARINAILRRPRTTGPSQSPLVVGALAIDPAAHELRLDGVLVDATPLELALLVALGARLAEHGFEQIRAGNLVDTYARSFSEDTREKAARFGAHGTTVRATKPLSKDGTP